MLMLTRALILLLGVLTTVRAEFDPTALERVDCHEIRPMTLAGTVTRLLAHPDGKRLLSASRDGSVRIWDIATGEELGRFDHSIEGVWCLALHPDGKRVLSGGSDSKVILWDLETQKEIREFVLSKRVYDLAIRPGGKQFVSGDSAKLLTLWDIESGEKVRELSEHKKYVYGVTFLDEDRSISASSDNGTFRIWEVDKDQPPPPEPEVKKVDAEEEKDAKKVAPANGAFEKVAPKKPAVKIEVNPVPKKALALDEVKKRPEISIVSKLSSGDIFSIAKHPSKPLIAACFEKGGLRLIDNEGKETWKVEIGKDPKSAAWSSDGKRLACITDAHEVILFEPEEGTNVIWKTKLKTDETWAITWAEDDKTIFASPGNRIMRLDPKTGEVAETFDADRPRPPRYPNALMVSADGDSLFVSSGRGMHRMDLESGRYDEEIILKGTNLLTATISPDGDTVLTATKKGLLVTFDAKTGEELDRTNMVAGCDVAALEFLDNQRISIGTSCKKIFVWNLESGEVETVVENGKLSNRGMAATADGSVIIGAARPEKGAGYEVLRWDSRSGQELQRLATGSEYPQRIRSHPDGRSILAVVDGTKDSLAFWQAPPRAKELSKKVRERHIKGLGADSFKDRKAAQKALEAGSGLTAARLRELVGKGDPEIRHRAEEALLKIIANDGMPEKPVKLNLEQECSDLKWHPDGKHWLAVINAGIHAEVAIGVIKEDKEDESGLAMEIVHRLKDGRGASQVALSADGEIVYVSNTDGSISVWAAE